MSDQISKTNNGNISFSFCFRLLRNFLDQKRKTVVLIGKSPIDLCSMSEVLIVLRVATC